MAEPPIACYLSAAVQSGYARAAEWQAWADRLITILDRPPAWVLEVSVARDEEALRRAIFEKVREEHIQYEGARNLDDVVLGYMWLRHERGDYDYPTFLRAAGEFADCSRSGFEPEDFYCELNEQEGRPSSLGYLHMPARSMSQEMHGPADRAKRQWDLLQNWQPNEG